jgi:hypothetical protein
MKIKIVSEAGGIVTRAKDKNLLVIYRKKYDDFTLPKGHVEKKMLPGKLLHCVR